MTRERVTRVSEALQLTLAALVLAGVISVSAEVVAAIVVAVKAWGLAFVPARRRIQSRKAVRVTD